MEEQQYRTNTFSEEGRLFQAEYAVKNVSKAGTIAGLCCVDGVILVGINKYKSTTLEKIYQLNEGAFCAVAGVFGDALRLIKFVRFESANIAECLGMTPRLSVLCEAVALQKQKYTHRGGARPFGVSFLYAGYEESEYVMYSTDPSGTMNRWLTWSFGANEDAINNGLRNTPPGENITVEEGIEYLLGVVGEAREIPPEQADHMEVLIYQKENPRLLDVSEVRELLDALQRKRREREGL